MRAISGRDVTFVVIKVGVVAALVAGFAGVALAGSYRPHASGVDVALLARDFDEIERWRDWRGATTIAALVCSCAAGVIVVVGRRNALRRPMATMCALAVAAFLATLTIVTTRRVEWDQLGLRSVTVGSDLSGYWGAAFGDDVRFVTVDAADLSQSSYARMLLLHLAAPFGAAISLMVAAAKLTGQRRRITPVEPSGQGDRASA